MIPLVYFLFAWLVLMLLFAIGTLITVVMAMRYGLSGLTMTLATAVFLFVTCLVLIGMAGYLLGVDWSQNINVMNSVNLNFGAPSL
jgi:hypothetical protein